ncbi:MAG: hypothetical protein KAT26_07800, partial [Marinosulfonomonas sp.]|nr:hypothetical protein [Marinosulfonomonas sp.]
TGHPVPPIPSLALDVVVLQALSRFLTVSVATGSTATASSMTTAFWYNGLHPVKPDTAIAMNILI